MNRNTARLIHAAEKAVNKLVVQCRKDGPLYELDPPAVAQVSRTGKWLLNALAKLPARLKSPPVKEYA